jgi:glycosyltransferase involved in cell wall biosynthesis
MKVTLINTSDAGGGAPMACMRLLKALQGKQVDAKLLTGDKKTGDSSVHTANPGLWGKIRAKYNFLAERLPFIAFNAENRSVRFAFSTAKTGTDITTQQTITGADVLHLHWTNQGFLSTNNLKQLVNLGKPIVWTLHDMWAIYRRMPLFWACNHFINQCGNCFMLRDPGNDDLSHTGWLRKSSLLGATNISIVTCSNWLAGVALQSSLLDHKSVQAIPNPIDTDLFSPRDRTGARQKWGVSAGAKVILFGAANINDTRKGIPYLVEALKLLSHDHPSEDIEIVIFGKNKHFDASVLPYPVIQLGTITNNADLAELYSLADVFVSPSIQDNLPNMIMEAMACGTPVAAFNTGGIPDLIDHNQNGYLAQFESARDLATGLYTLLNAGDGPGKAAREKVLTKFNNQTVAGQYLQLYNSLLTPMTQ